MPTPPGCHRSVQPRDTGVAPSKYRLPVKRDHTDRIKEPKAAAKDIEKMLSAQIRCLDRQFLLRRERTGAARRRRHDSHPLLGAVTRRILWNVDGVVCGGADGVWRDLSGRQVGIGEPARVACGNRWARPMPRSWRGATGGVGIGSSSRSSGRTARCAC